MSLHRHTVGYRLARFQEVSGLSPYESDGRERLSLGLKAHQILEAHGVDSSACRVASARRAPRRCSPWDDLSRPQPRTSSAAVRTVFASPPMSSVVTLESRHASRSWRILSLGPISVSCSISLVGTAAAASSLWPER